MLEVATCPLRTPTYRHSSQEDAMDEEIPKSVLDAMRELSDLVAGIASQHPLPFDGAADDLPNMRIRQK